MENIGNSGLSRNRITSKYTYLRNSLEFRVVLEPCERILTVDECADGGEYSPCVWEGIGIQYVADGLCHHAIFHAHFLTVFSTLSLTHSFISFTLPLLSSLSTLFSCYQLAIRLTTFTNSYDLTTIPFILFLFFLHTLSFDEMRTRQIPLRLLMVIH